MRILKTMDSKSTAVILTRELVEQWNKKYYCRAIESKLLQSKKKILQENRRAMKIVSPHRILFRRVKAAKTHKIWVQAVMPLLS